MLIAQFIMTRFVIDTYNKYDLTDQNVTRKLFFYNDSWWAIKEYTVRDGELMRPRTIEEPDNINDCFRQYDTLEEAQAFVRKLRGM